jgi:hypothetical protein
MRWPGARPHRVSAGPNPGHFESSAKQTAKEKLVRAAYRKHRVMAQPHSDSAPRRASIAVTVLFVATHSVVRVKKQALLLVSQLASSVAVPERNTRQPKQSTSLAKPIRR